MSVMDILSQYLNPTPSAAATSEAHFDEVSRSLSPGELGRGVSETLRADETPPFGDMVSQMFGGSNPSLRAGLLNQLIGSVGPALLGKLGAMFANRGAGAPATFSESDAERVTPAQVREMAQEAEKADPGVMDQIGNFYAKHPEVVKVLGGAALAIALGRIANRTPR